MRISDWSSDVCSSDLDDPGEAVLVHIVAQAQHERAIDRLHAVVRHLAPRGRAVPPGSAAPPLGDLDRLLEGGKLRGEAVVGVQHEGGAVEHQLVLAAYLVHVDERQACLAAALHRELDALLGLVQLVGRAVDDDEDLGAGLLQALAHVGRPHVLADHDAETHAAKVHRAGQRPCAEHALLVRSEEHTSELQSLMRIPYAVFCLKKKNTKKIKTETIHLIHRLHGHNCTRILPYPVINDNTCSLDRALEPRHTAT